GGGGWAMGSRSGWGGPAGKEGEGDRAVGPLAGDPQVPERDVGALGWIVLGHGTRPRGQPAGPLVKEPDRPRPQAEPLRWRHEDDVERRGVAAQVREHVRRYDFRVRRQ